LILLGFFRDYVLIITKLADYKVVVLDHCGDKNVEFYVTEISDRAAIGLRLDVNHGFLERFCF
jgi:hypothetical protein